MGLYILKLTAILIIFWLIYVLILEREKMHTFKRFYLITSILAAVIIPLLSITEYVYVAPIEDTFEFSSYAFPLIQETVIEEVPFFTLDRILWTIYILGAIIFGLRFLKNLGTLLYTIKQNEKVKQWTFTYVLLKKAINPHTFFNYIFFNKSTFENKSLPKAVILHEETHAKQKHSIDVLFIELFQVIFWFHPLAYLYKKNIKLNHEFLADQAVLNKGIEATNYQNILLTFSSQNENYQLANAINYSSIKKRFTVMKTKTSKTKTWVTSLLVLPLLAVLFYSFSSREVIEIEKEINSEILKTEKDLLHELALKNHYTKQLFTVKDDYGLITKKQFNELNEDYKKKWVYVESIPFQEKQISELELESFKEKNKYIIKVNNQDITESEIEKYKASDFVTYTVTPISELAEMKQKYVCNLIEKSLFDSYKDTSILHYQEVYTDFEKKIKTLKDVKIKHTDQIVSTYLFLQDSYEEFTTDIIEKYDLKAPTKIDESLVKSLKNSFLNIPVLLIDKDHNLFLNEKPTTLETIKDDFDKIKNVETPQLELATEDPVNIKFIEKISSTIGVSISSSGQAQVYDEDVNYAIINSKQINGTGTKLTLEQLKNLTISHKWFDIKSFDVLLPDGKTYTLKGNRLNNNLKSKIEGLKIGQIISLNEIKNTGNIDLVPVLIEISLTQQTPPKKEEVAAYNAWAKKIHSKSKVFTENAIWFPPVNEQDLIKFTDIYNRMTKAQKASSQEMPFPDAKLQEKATPEQVKDYNDWVRGVEADRKDAVKHKKYIAPIEDAILEKYKYIYSIMSEEQKKNAMPFPKIGTPPPPPVYSGLKGKLSSEHIQAYNNWAKKLNATPINDRIINEQAKKYYTTIHNAMTSEQRKKAEAFPKIVPPPPPPPLLPPVVKGNVTTSQIKAYNKWAKSINATPIANRLIKAKTANYFIKIREAMTPSQRRSAEPFPEVLPPPAKPKIIQVKESKSKTKKKPNDEPLVIEEVEEPIRKNNEKISKTVIEAYKKKHPESISKTEVDGEIVEVVEIPSNQEGTTNILGENYKYTIKDGVTTYYDSKGKKYTEDDFKTHIINIEKQQKKIKKSIKTKGGPNADPIEIVFTDKTPEKPSAPNSKDYMTRYVILKASKNQTQPLVYKLNGKLSDATSIENYLKSNHEANVSFKQGDNNVLHFFDKKGSKMTATALQNVYTELYKTYKKTDNTLIYGRILPKKEGSPNRQKSKSNNNKQQAKIDNNKRVDIKALKVVESRTAYNGVSYHFYVKNNGSTVIPANSYNIVFKVNGKTVSFDRDTNQLNPGQAIKYSMPGTFYKSKNGILDYAFEIKVKDADVSNNILRGQSKVYTFEAYKKLTQNSKISQEQIAKSIKTINDYAATNTYEKMAGPDSEEKRAIKKYLEVLNKYSATNTYQGSKITKGQVAKSIKALDDYAATNTYEKMMGPDTKEKQIMRKHLQVINEYSANNSL